MSDEHDYEVGYGKPPAAHRFQKGQSGNPKGRPKGSLDYRTSVQQALSARVTVTEGGKRKKVSSLQATLMRLSEKALRGDIKAIVKVLDLADGMAVELYARQAERSLSQSEAQILARYAEVMRAEPAPGAEDGPDDGNG